MVSKFHCRKTDATRLLHHKIDQPPRYDDHLDDSFVADPLLDFFVGARCRFDLGLARVRRDKQIVKVIVVPGRLINFVVK